MKCFIFIKNMHAGIKYKITVNGMSSNFFYFNAGVRQVENLSYFLFSLYIKDLEKYLIEKGINVLKNFFKDIEDDLCIFMKLLILFYADNTVILSETPSDL